MCLEAMSPAKTGLFQHREDITIKGEHVFPRTIWWSVFLSDLAMSFPKWCFQTCKYHIICSRNSSDYNYPHKERWFHLLVVSRGLSDSQHSLRCYYPHFLRGIGQFHGHLNFRATSSFTFRKTCIGRPDT